MSLGRRAAATFDGVSYLLDRDGLLARGRGLGEMVTMAAAATCADSEWVHLGVRRQRGRHPAVHRVGFEMPARHLDRSPLG
jgi:hypothetical protein